MTRSDLVQKLAAERNISITVAEAIVFDIFNGMTDTLISGGRIEVRGFGNFEVREYDGYIARNPKTGVQIEVKPKKMPFFKTGKDLKDRIMNRSDRE